MTETEARSWIAARFGEKAAGRIARLLDMIVEENSRQNLIAPSTVATIWQRHALDSAQLLAFDRPGVVWLDVGTGGGFPGLVVALLRDDPVVMLEPRNRRAAFLAASVAELELTNARVVPVKVERWMEPADIISARAVASIDAILETTHRLTDRSTRWILPRGRGAVADKDMAQRSWRGMFHVEQSLADADSGIVIAEKVERR